MDFRAKFCADERRGSKSGFSKEEIAKIIQASKLKEEMAKSEEEVNTLDIMLKASTTVDLPLATIFKGGAYKIVLPRCVNGISKLDGENFHFSIPCEIRSSVLLRKEDLFCITDNKSTFLASRKTDFSLFGYVVADNSGFIWISDRINKNDSFVAGIIADITGYFKDIGH